MLHENTNEERLLADSRSIVIQRYLKMVTLHEEMELEPEQTALLLETDQNFYQPPARIHA
ncbi:hypothetical protein D3C71_2218520 [compost metagenome]